MKGLILAVLLSLPPSVTDTETPEARVARISVAATAIAAASARATCSEQWEGPGCRRRWPGSREQLAAALLALGWHETRWAQYVGEGRCAEGPPGQRCDPDRAGRPRARSYWQVWRVAWPQLWKTRPGSPEAVQEAAWGAAVRMSGAWWRCRKQAVTPLAGAFSGYRALSCTWPSATDRAATTQRMLVRLHAAERARSPP